MAETAGTTKGQAPNRVFLVVVDDTEEMHAALLFASLRAKRSNGRVALLRVIEPVEFQHWASVGRLMRTEAREEAEQLLQRFSEQVNKWSGTVPVLYVREGKTAEVLLELIDEEPSIRVLVLGADTGPNGPGPLVTALTGKLVSQLRVPLTIVPGNMTDDQLEAMAGGAQG